MLLPTAIISVKDERGRCHTFRALLDPCSEVNLTSLSLIRSLGVSLEKVHASVSGVGGETIEQTRIRSHINLHLPESSNHVPIEIYCLKKLGITTPSTTAGQQVLQLWKDLKLADQKFGIPQKIDILLVAGMCSRLLRPGLIKCKGFIAQQTVLGWVISGTQSLGSLKGEMIACPTFYQSHNEQWEETLIRLLQRFWELEDIPKIHRKSPNDEDCERIFHEHHRAPDGRYVVRLPLKPNGLDLLGQSLASATATLVSMHKRMARDSDLAEEYKRFMMEYIKCGHMRALTEEELSRKDYKVNYIPHHAIWQKGDQKRKIRVVFNASRATSSGYSLNDVMYAGPTLLNNLAAVLMRWRK